MYWGLFSHFRFSRNEKFEKSPVTSAKNCYSWTWKAAWTWHKIAQCLATFLPIIFTEPIKTLAARHFNGFPTSQHWASLPGNKERRGERPQWVVGNSPEFFYPQPLARLRPQKIRLILIFSLENGIHIFSPAPTKSQDRFQWNQNFGPTLPYPLRAKGECTYTV